MGSFSQSKFNGFKPLIISAFLKNRKAILVVMTLLIAIFSADYAYYSYWHVSTENAYVNANVVRVAPQVTGQVAHLYIENNQFVKKDQVLFDLDFAPFILALLKAKAQLAISESNWKNVQLTAARTLTLVNKKVLSSQEGDNAIAALQSAAASLDSARASLAQADLNLHYARVTSPTKGWVTDVSLQVGNAVEANQALFALISNASFWIDANFKETELQYIQPGQRAEIELDMYPHHIFKGVVESISGGSGTVFSLLPPQNATGNWVKVTQRVPVRIRILNPDASFPLRIGTTAAVAIDIRPSLQSKKILK